MFQTQFVHQVREEEEPGFESQPPRSGSRPTEGLDSASVPGKREASRRHHDQAPLQVRFSLESFSAPSCQLKRVNSYLLSWGAMKKVRIQKVLT